MGRNNPVHSWQPQTSRSLSQKQAQDGLRRLLPAQLGPEGAGWGGQRERTPRKGWLMLRLLPGQRAPVGPSPSPSPRTPGRQGTTTAGGTGSLPGHQQPGSPGHSLAERDLEVSDVPDTWGTPEGSFAMADS